MTATKDTLLTAMLAVQASAPTLKKDRTVTVKSERTGKEYSYQYAPLDSITETVRPLLTENALVWTTRPSNRDDGTPILKYKLAHAPTGEAIEDQMNLIIGEGHEGDVQALGSSITYTRRYALCAVLDLVADADDDGRAAGGGQGSQGATCPTCGADAIIKGKAEYGGGWICFKKKGGCGAKFAYDPAEGEPPVDRVKRLVRKHNVKAGELRTMISGLGVDVPKEGNVVDLVEGLTAEKASELADFIEGNPIPTGEPDVPGDAGEFKHPEPSDEDRRMLEGSAAS